MNAAATAKKKPGSPARGSLADKAYHAIEERIVTLQLAPGAVLSEQQLAQELSVGRSPVREAIQRLAHERLVRVLPRRGILVSDINLGTHRRLLEARRVVERLLVRLACRAASDSQVRDFARLAGEFRREASENDVRGFLRTDFEFNDLLAASADNEFVVKCIQLMRGLSRRFWYKYYKVADLGRCSQLHASIADAIALRDVAAAERGLDRLIDYMEEFTKAVFDSR
jgi:DNA-binding GntR family transcriptional regulator